MLPLAGLRWNSVSRALKVTGAQFAGFISAITYRGKGLQKRFTASSARAG
jgi:hypothetical protein